MAAFSSFESVFAMSCSCSEIVALMSSLDGFSLYLSMYLLTSTVNELSGVASYSYMIKSLSVGFVIKKTKRTISKIIRRKIIANNTLFFGFFKIFSA